MTIEIKHKFQSAKADSGDVTLIRPSNWNDTHNLEMGTSAIIGRYSGGSGSAQEVGLGAWLEFVGSNIDVAATIKSLVNAKAPSASPTFTGTPTAPTPDITDSNTELATTEFAQKVVALWMPGFLYGMELSNNGVDAANDFNVAAGFANATQATPSMMKLTASITKRLDAVWSVGTNGGCLDAGVVGNSVYHIFAIHRPDTEVTDILASLSPTAPTLPANYTMSRRIGSLIRVAGAILQFSQRGDEFLLENPPLDYNGTQTTAGTNRAVTVPTGVVVDAKIRVRANNATTWFVLVTSPAVDDLPPSNTDAPLHDLGGSGGVGDRSTLCVRTNTNGEIRTRGSTAIDNIVISTIGWIDTRGK